jgi:hypothetical protein
MNIISELSALLETLGIKFETGHYSGKPPDEYVVIVPLGDSFEAHADNAPQQETQNARLSIYAKKNYYPLRNRLVKALIQADFHVTDRRFIGFEADTKIYHYAVEVQKLYELEE